MPEDLPVSHYLIISKDQTDSRVYVYKVNALNGARMELCSFKTWDAAEAYCLSLERVSTPRSGRVVTAIRRWMGR